MFHATRRTVAVVDLTGYARLAQTRDDLAVARLLDDFYRLCHARIREAGGRVVKFLGDACLATFDPESTAAAVAGVVAIRRGVRELEPGLDVGINVHLTGLVEGDFGPDEDRRHDVIGGGVNHTFLLGRGPGIRLSEPVYRKLPSDARGPWTKRAMPAIYVREEVES